MRVILNTLVVVGVVAAAALAANGGSVDVVKSAAAPQSADELGALLREALRKQGAAMVAANGEHSLHARSLRALRDGPFQCAPPADDESSIECCVTVAKLNVPACARADYIEEEHALQVQVTALGVTLFEKKFDKLETYYCTKEAKGLLGLKVCANVTQESFSATGACGCLDATFSLGFGKFPVKIGCYAFGKECFSTNCGGYSDSCKMCSILRSCGYCATTEQCVQGQAAGPIGSFCQASDWSFDKGSCS